MFALAHAKHGPTLTEQLPRVMHTPRPMLPANQLICLRQHPRRLHRGLIVTVCTQSRGSCRDAPGSPAHSCSAGPSLMACRGSQQMKPNSTAQHSAILQPAHSCSARAADAVPVEALGADARKANRSYPAAMPTFTPACCPFWWNLPNKGSYPTAMAASTMSCCSFWWI